MILIGRTRHGGVHDGVAARAATRAAAIPLSGRCVTELDARSCEYAAAAQGLFWDPATGLPGISFLPVRAIRVALNA